ncbi:flagellar biosynthesis anti-sigma factor FlgM [Erythrobacter sp. 3-20A1M]|nr:flagellar biosynthesis anti-sigma factor FlgM [Erythrobacter sp. 3-20A1M]
MPQTSVKSGRQEAGVLVETKALLAESGPPVDNDRVREIRKAVSDGTYPLSPTRVADAMIAAKFMLSDRK